MRVVLDTCILKLATFPADNNASALIYELARSGLIEAWVSPAILDEYADVIGDHPELVADIVENFPGVLSADRAQCHPPRTRQPFSGMRAWCERGIHHHPDGPAIVGQALAVAGQRGEALAVLNKLLPPHPAVDTLTCGITPGCITPFAMAMLYTGLGEKDEAFRFLERPTVSDGLFYQCSKVDPAFDSLRSDARFSNLVRGLGLEP